jgi:4-hydroxyphenylpyruvate dioxygenase
MAVPIDAASKKEGRKDANAATSNGPTVGRRELAGAKSFVRSNPMSDLFEVEKFDHIEFWCGDARTTSCRFGLALGLTLVAKSDHSTGNREVASYVMQSNEIRMTFTAPYGNDHPAHDFFKAHGIAVRAVGIRVRDAAKAFEACAEHGGVPVKKPQVIESSGMTLAEVQLYGDVVLRFVSGENSAGSFMPGYAPVNVERENCYGLQRMDHIVGNVPDLISVRDYLMECTGFHEFAEFVAEDVGTVDSGLNSVVLTSNNEMVILPVNEPTFNTPRKSQIQTYLEQNGGAGVQHVALKTDNIFATLRKMRDATSYGGFEFMPAPGVRYYEELPSTVGPYLTEEEFRTCEELGVLVDRDDQGILLQIFTKPVGDRSTFFFEIIQRICTDESGDVVQQDVAGCGGFGKGNFRELFKSIERHESNLGIN